MPVGVAEPVGVGELEGVAEALADGLAVACGWTKISTVEPVGLVV